MKYQKTMRKIRRRLKLTQTDVAAAMGRTRQHYQYYETGRKFPLPSLFARFRAVLIEGGADEEEIERMDNLYMDDRARIKAKRRKEREKAKKEAKE